MEHLKDDSCPCSARLTIHLEMSVQLEYIDGCGIECVTAPWWRQLLHVRPQITAQNKQALAAYPELCLIVFAVASRSFDQ